MSRITMNMLDTAIENQSNKPWGLFGHELFLLQRQEEFLKNCNTLGLSLERMIRFGESRMGRKLGDWFSFGEECDPVILNGFVVAMEEELEI